MNNKTKNILLGVLFVAIVIVYIWISIAGKNVNKTNTYYNEDYIKPTEVTGNYLFFSIDNIIQKVISETIQGNAEALINLYSTDYLNAHGYNSNNIIDKLTGPYERMYRYVKKIYYSCNVNNCYYFVNVCGVNEAFEWQDSKAIKSEYQIVILDSNTNAFRVLPIEETIDDIGKYINNYDFKDVSIPLNEYNRFEEISIETADLITYYLDFAYFILEYEDPDVIEEYMVNYNYYDTNEYLDMLSNVLYSYRKELFDDRVRYSGNLYGGSVFVINEYGPMNFKLEL